MWPGYLLVGNLLVSVVVIIVWVIDDIFTKKY